MQAPPALMALVISANGVQVQLLDLAANVGLAQGEALADDPAFLLFVGVHVDAQTFQIDAPFLAQLNTAASRASAPMTEQWIFCRGKPSR